MSTPDVESLSYEQAREELQDVVRRLETGAATLEVLGDGSARIADGNGYGSPGELVHWERDGDGRVDAVRIAGGRHVPFEQQVRELTAHAQAQAGALNVARHFEIDDVVDPAETRGLLARLVSAAARDGRLVGSGAAVDTW